MFVILNKANLVVCSTEVAKMVKQLPGGKMALSTEDAATAIYAADTDAFYPLDSTAGGTIGAYRAVEVEEVPAEVVPGYWYYTGEFFTTPEKEEEYAELVAQKEAVRASSIAFVTLAESGNVDDITATENASQFSAWAYPVAYVEGNIRRDPADGGLYRVNEGQAHTSQEGWNPSLTPNLWGKVGDPGEEWPEWVQPIGAHDTYALGDKVAHNGENWVSDYDANVYEPGVFGWTQQ